MQSARLGTLICLILCMPALAQLPPNGGRIVLEGSEAIVKGERLQYSEKNRSITGLAKPPESIEWKFKVEKTGWYQVVVHYALKEGKNLGQSAFNASIGDQNRLGPIHATGAVDRFLPQVLFNPVELTAGIHQLKLQLKALARPLDLRISKVELVRAREPGIP